MTKYVRDRYLTTREGLAIVQVFGSTIGLGTTGTLTKFMGETATLSVSDEMLGRTFNGLGKPRDKDQQLYQNKSLIW